MQFYKVDIFNSENKPLSEKQILGQLEAVMDKSSHLIEPIGILTTQHRDKWANAYADLTVGKLCLLHDSQGENTYIIDKLLYPQYKSGRNQFCFVF